MWVRSSSRPVAIVAALLLLVATGGPAAGSLGSAGAPSPAQMGSGAHYQQGVDTDSVRLIVSVDGNGSASWTVQYWTRLDDENTTEAFDSLQSDVESDPEIFADRFASRMGATVDTAENATGRDMNATGFDVSADTRAPPQYGVVTYTFRWDGFAAVDGDAVRVGDAIEGLFLDDRTRLVVEWPTAYDATQVAPTPDERRSNAAVWRGATTNFVSGEPTVDLAPRSPGTTGSGGDGETTATAGGSAGDGGATPTASPNDGGSTIPVSLVGVGLLFALVGVGVWRYRDRADDGVPDDGTTAGDAVAAEAGHSDADGAQGADGAEPADSREDLLSNEERVLQFVREEGGRVKQQEIVEAFDWTEARTSQIVRDLRDDGSLEGFRLGRENVLKIPDSE